MADLAPERSIPPRFDGLVQAGRVHGSAYTSADVFDAEMECLFAQGWVYVAHESEVAAPGDFVTKQMGGQPVIVSRTKNGAVTVLANRCAHRGNKVCQAAAGNSLTFRCQYHGWSYSNDGQLIAIPMKQGYGDRHDDLRDELHLVACPRIDSYGGFVFASFAAEGVTLLEHLGRATTAIDRLNDLSPTGRISLGAGWMKHRQRCNWKMVMENNVDGYHALFVHPSVYEAVRPAKVSHVPSKVDVVVRDMGNGHGEIDYTQEYEKLDEEFVWFGRIPRAKLRNYVSAMEDVYGSEKTHHSFVVGPPHTMVFPNLFLAEMNVMVIEPHAADDTVAYTTPALIGDFDEMNSRILRRCEGAMGPSGFLLADDAEIGARNQMGLVSRNPEWVEISRGLDSDMHDETGTVNDDKSAETPQRGFWRQWSRVMSAQQ